MSRFSAGNVSLPPVELLDSGTMYNRAAYLQGVCSFLLRGAHPPGGHWSCRSPEVVSNLVRAAAVVPEAAWALVEHRGLHRDLNAVLGQLDSQLTACAEWCVSGRASLWVCGVCAACVRRVCGVCAACVRRVCGVCAACVRRVCVWCVAG